MVFISYMCNWLHDGVEDRQKDKSNVRKNVIHSFQKDEKYCAQTGQQLG